MIRIDLTRRQQEHYYQANGAELRRLEFQPQELCALLLWTAALERGAPASGHILTTTLELTPEQQAQIHRETGRVAERLTLPDGDHSLTVYAESWRQDATYVPVGRSLAIVQVGAAHPPIGDRHEIALKPDPDSERGVFGSGCHGTTQICLLFLEEHLHPGMRVLDVGTGSGVLAIAAMRLGAQSVTAVDTDLRAVLAAQENVAANGLTDQVSVMADSLDVIETAGYDLVVANILAGVIVSLAPELARVVKPDGILLTSGLRASRVDEVTGVLRDEGFQRLQHRALGEWNGLAARRKDDSARMQDVTAR